MKYLLAALAVVSLAACGDKLPPLASKGEPAPAAAAPTPAPQAKAPETPQPAPKAEAPKPDPNKELAQKVKRALEEDAKIQAAAIDVSASNGVVTLWGTAATQGERNRAGAAAAKVDGVQSVENKLAVVKGS
jgi:hypothetical protein